MVVWCITLTVSDRCLCLRRALPSSSGLDIPLYHEIEIAFDTSSLVFWYVARFRSIESPLLTDDVVTCCSVYTPGQPPPIVCVPSNSLPRAWWDRKTYPQGGNSHTVSVADIRANKFPVWMYPVPLLHPVIGYSPITDHSPAADKPTAEIQPCRGHPSTIALACCCHPRLGSSRITPWCYGLGTNTWTGTD